MMTPVSYLLVMSNSPCAATSNYRAFSHIFLFKSARLVPMFIQLFFCAITVFFLYACSYKFNLVYYLCSSLIFLSMFQLKTQNKKTTTNKNNKQCKNWERSWIYATVSTVFDSICAFGCIEGWFQMTVQKKGQKYFYISNSSRHKLISKTSKTGKMYKAIDTDIFWKGSFLREIALFK